jgi:hypothetical protein
MLIVRLSRGVARDPGGFTLIETLVALVTGAVVVLILFTMLKVATDQTRLISGKVESDRLGRQVMTRISDQLQSACVSREVAPILSSSEGAKLVFFNAYTEGAEIKSVSASKKAAEGVYKHEIVFKPGEEDTGTLTEKIYPSTSVSLPSTPKFAETAEKEIRIAEHLGQTTKVEGGKEVTVPVFEYLKYAKEASTTANSSVTSLEKIKLAEKETLKEKEKVESDAAPTAAGVRITFEQTPARKKETTNEHKLHQGVALQSQVTLALGSPASETPIQDAPCD